MTKLATIPCTVLLGTLFLQEELQKKYLVCSFCPSHGCRNWNCYRSAVWYPGCCFVCPCNYYYMCCLDWDECHPGEVQGFSNVRKPCIHLVSIMHCHSSSLAYFWTVFWLVKMHLLSNMHHKFWFSLFHLAWSLLQLILIPFLWLAKRYPSPTRFWDAWKRA